MTGAGEGDGSRYSWPMTLREFLDSGGDLTSFGLLDSLVEAIVVARRLLPDETNRRQAFRNRRFVDRWFDRHGGEPAIAATQELLTFALWKAECLEDPVLAERFEASLPAETLARGLRLVEDLRHVHPLAIEEDLTNWTCRACGETWEMAPAVVVTNTGDELGYDDDLAYCLGCLSIATSALESASGIDHFSRSLEEQGLGIPRPRSPTTKRRTTRSTWNSTWPAWNVSCSTRRSCAARPSASPPRWRRRNGAWRRWRPAGRR